VAVQAVLARGGTARGVRHLRPLPRLGRMGGSLVMADRQNLSLPDLMGDLSDEF
jgi:hypothetical protein